jgi:hypothetical protein
VCAGCADPAAGAVSPDALGLLSHLGLSDLSEVGMDLKADRRTRREARALLFGFAEYHLERRMRSVPMLVRTAR